jgi:serine/threonine-protein kinase HipA
VLAEVVGAVKQWRDVALTADVGLAQAELEVFAPAFEHAGLDEALSLLG